MSIDGWIDKEDVVHIYNGILVSHKKEWNHAICSNMDEPRNYHTKWNKSERERQILYGITYMWNIKYDTNGDFLGGPVVKIPCFHYGNIGSIPGWGTNTLRVTWHNLPPQKSKIWHKQTCLHNRNRITNIKNRLVVAKGEGAGEGMDWKVAVSRWKLLYRE